MIVNFRFSDSDFSTYLILKGYEPKEIEIIYDKRHDRLKAFTHFEGKKEDFIKLQSEYKQGEILVNPIEFSKTRKELNTIIKNKLNEYRELNKSKNEEENTLEM